MPSPNSRTRLAGALAALLIASAAAAARADAATFCVKKPGCSGTPVGLGAALELAADADGDDRVEIGPGTFATPTGFAFAGATATGGLQLIGSGPATVLAADAPDS